MGDADELRRTAALVSSAREQVEREADAVAAVGAGLGESLPPVVRAILGAPGKVVTVGVGTSGPIARRLAHLLSTTGTAALFLHPVDALHGGLGAIGPGDVVIAISKGGQSAELNEFAVRAKGRGARLIVLTVAPDAPLAATADHVVVLPDVPAADPGGIVAMGSSLVAAAWGDALAFGLMAETGYGWDEVLASHPFGAVGRRGGPG